MQVAQVDDILERIGPVLRPEGIAAFSEMRSWGIALDDETSILLDLSEEGDRLLATVEVGTPTITDRALLYELMLRHAYLVPQTGGSRLALDAPGGGIVLVSDVTTQNLDADRLTTFVRSVGAAARAWREIVKRPPSHPSRPPLEDTDIPLIRI